MGLELSTGIGDELPTAKSTKTFKVLFSKQQILLDSFTVKKY